MTLVRPADVLVIAVAALLVGIAWAGLWVSGGPAEYAAIAAPGAPELRVDLSRAATLQVRGRLGDSRVEVRDGQVRFIDSPCVGRYCVHAGWLSRTGQVAACLPNGVVIELVGRDREFDAISF